MSGWTIFYTLLCIYWVLVVVFLVGANRNPTTTLAWILILCFIPGLGLVLYYFVGRDWAWLTSHSKWLKERERIRVPFMRELYDLDKEQSIDFFESAGCNMRQDISHSIWTQTEVRPLLARDVEIFPSGISYFPKLLADLASAQDTINMQYFIWEEDELTDQVVEVLLERMKHGVQVRILNDFFGNIFYGKKGLKRLKQAGARVLSDVTAIKQANYRNHRKITVIDGILAHTGGVNIGQEYIDGGKKYDSWRDTGMRLRGPAVFALQDLFAKRWFEVAGISLYIPRFFPVDQVGSGNVMTQVAAQAVEDYWRASTRAYEIAITSATDQVLVQSPYYVPTEGMEEALVNAALSGSDVHLMITGVPDKKIAWYAAFTYFEKLLRAGAHVHLYEKGFFHAKSIVVDNQACAVGTMNLDVRSLDLHKELMVWLFDDQLTEQNRKIFEDDLRDCREVTLEELTSMSRLARFRNSAARLASKLL